MKAELGGCLHFGTTTVGRSYVQTMCGLKRIVLAL